VWALALVFVMSVVALLGAAVGERSIERQRAAAAADVAALAAAESPGDPCGRALRWATVNQARLVECRVTDGDIVVRVSRPPSALVRHLFSLLGRSPTDVIGVARAGPP
jgi:secretion/DNA translocation related TadE-like protein